MKIKLSQLVAVSALTMSVSACTHENSVLNNAPGTYESSTSRTNSNGTNVEQDSTAKVRYDAYGNKEAVVKTKTTTDIMNIQPYFFDKSRFGTAHL